MSDLINLTCPSCGGKLQITGDIDRFACSYCGNEHIVRRSGGIVSLAPVVEGLKEVKTGVDKTASELAISRLEGEITTLKAQRAEAAKMPNWPITVGAIGILFIIGSLIQTRIPDNLGTAIFMLITGIALIAVAFWINSVFKRAVRNRRAPINQKLEEKTKELKRHRAIVEGRK